MLMALIIMRPKDVKWIVFLQLGLYLIIPAVWDGLAYAQVLSTFWLIVAVGGLMLVSAFATEGMARARPRIHAATMPYFLLMFFIALLVMLENTHK